MASKAILFHFTFLFLVVSRVSANEQFQEKDVYPKVPVTVPTPLPIYQAPPLVKAPYTPNQPGAAPVVTVRPLPKGPYTPNQPGVAPYTPPLVKAPPPPVKAPYTPAPPVKAPYTPAPPVKAPYTPAPPKAPYTPSPPVKAPYTPAPPVKAPSPPPVKAPYTPAPPVMPPPVVPKPPPVSGLGCYPLCGRRCDLHSRKNLCVRACVTCCNRCKCVPPGTYGNREVCGKCYTDMTTHGNRIKCP